MIYELICSRCGLVGTHEHMAIERDGWRCRDRPGCARRVHNGDLPYLRLHLYCHEEQTVMQAMSNLDDDLESL